MSEVVTLGIAALAWFGGFCLGVSFEANRVARELRRLRREITERRLASW